MLLPLPSSFLSLMYFFHPEMIKLGPDARGSLFIQLTNFLNHYLVVVVTDEKFKYALITTKAIEGHMFAMMVLEDIAWLDFDRLHHARTLGSEGSKTSLPVTLKQAAVKYKLERSYSG